MLDCALFPYTTLFRSEPEPFCQRIKIRAYPTREYFGIVWAYLGEGNAPEFRRIPQMEPEDERTFRLIRGGRINPDRKSTRLNSSHRCISYAVFCLKKK